MIRIPPEVAIKATIRPGSVYYFPEDSFHSEQPHYFIVINADPTSDLMIILVCASSQIEKTKLRRRSCPTETIVEISTDQYSEFTVNSIIDCNYVLEKSIDQLIVKLKAGELVLKTEMDIELVNVLRMSVLSSPELNIKNNS